MVASGERPAVLRYMDCTRTVNDEYELLTHGGQLLRASLLRASREKNYSASCSVEAKPTCVTKGQRELLLLT